jgi:hypothetical protein
MKNARLLGVAIALGLCAAAARPAAACEMADRYTLVPLGTLDGAVVALELDQFRDSETMAGPRLWRMTPRLVSLGAGDPGARSVIAEYAEVTAREADYTKKLQPVIARAARDAGALDGFTRAVRVARGDCNHLAACGAWTATVAGDELVVAGPDGARQVARLPELFAKHVNVDADTVQRYLASVRVYRAGQRSWAVVELGTGSDVDPCAFAASPSCVDDRRASWRDDARPVRAGAALEPPHTLHHGESFDIIVGL